jgi:hypothetical protein
MTTDERRAAAVAFTDALRDQLLRDITDARDEDASCWDIYDQILIEADRLREQSGGQPAYLHTARDKTSNLVYACSMFLIESLGGAPNNWRRP